MAEMTIRLQCDPVTGKRDIVVTLHSNDDSLPHEHEHLHRELVEKLISQGIVQATEIGQVTIERDADQGTPAAPANQSEAEERRSQSQGE